MLEREVLLTNGWRRHSIISSNDPAYATFLSMLPESQKQIAIDKSAIAILATYDCAIVNPNTNSEPWLHILIAFKVNPNKQFFSGRNPRCIHFEVIDDGNIEHYETNAACIAQMERAPIVSEVNQKNSVTLTERAKFDLLNWISERFKLTTWPDNFNSALKPVDKRLKSFWKRYNEYISALYIDLNTYEEVNSDEYKISIIIALENNKQRNFIKKVRELNQNQNLNIDEANSIVENEVANIFKNCIEINEDRTNSSKLAIKIIEEKSITLHQLRSFYRFSPYSLSELNTEASLPLDIIQHTKV